jgi:hypothetical protein
MIMANIQKQIIINHCSLRPTKSPIQPKISTKINFFMQNKANFTKSQMYVSRVSTKNYAERTLSGVGKTKPNKANSKPIKANLKKS